MQPQEQLQQIASEVHACQRCDLYLQGKRGVPGSGAYLAEIMGIAEAPSPNDERHGYPFSGPSGVFLDELLALAGINRADIYLTNMVKHHPPQSRELFPGEIAACAHYLEREIAAVNPKVIVAMGRSAAARFFPKARISIIHGQAKLAGGRIVIAMYNPAAALHQEALRPTIIDDFTRAIPAALVEARRLAAEGKLGGEHANHEPPPEQMALF